MNKRPWNIELSEQNYHPKYVVTKSRSEQISIHSSPDDYRNVIAPQKEHHYTTTLAEIPKYKYKDVTWHS